MAKRFATREAALQFIDIQPITVIRQMLADYLTEEKIDKIVITEEQFRQFFKVKGIDSEGKVERRGRPKKDI